MHVMFDPHSQDDPGCWVQPPELSCNAHCNGAQAAVNSTANELFESMSDPNIDAWVSIPYPSTSGNEIGDPCNFTYKHCVTLNDGSKSQIQMMWSDWAGACKQTAGE